MRDLKYVIIKLGPYEIAILFNGLISHSQIANKFENVISAGFCSVNTQNEIIVHSEKPTSINLKPRIIKDTIIIQNTLHRLTI